MANSDGEEDGERSIASSPLTVSAKVGLASCTRHIHRLSRGPMKGAGVTIPWNASTTGIPQPEFSQVRRSQWLSRER